MGIFTKVKHLLQYASPVVLMIGCIPFVENDSILTGLYIGITLIGQYIYREKHDGIVYLMGFIFMLVSESIFISTGVETFERKSLFGLMPLWLPFLWAYGFIAIRRAIHVIEK